MSKIAVLKSDTTCNQESAVPPEHDQDLDTLMASTIRLLTLAIHDDDPNQLLTARRLLQSLEQHPKLCGHAATSAVVKANELLTSHLTRCLTGVAYQTAPGGSGPLH